jgi:hypothetical protein
MQDPRAKHICFYSNRCQWSKAFLVELSKTSYKTEFKYVCVDPSPQRPPLPKFLKKVPTILINGESEPRTDGEVMNWLSERRLRDPSYANNQVVETGPSEYYSCEMDSLGQDMYSFLDSDTLTSGNGGNKIRQTFAFVDEMTEQQQAPSGQGQRQGQQPQAKQVGLDGGHNPKRSKKEELFDKQYEEYMKSRDNGMPQTRPRL